MGRTYTKNNDPFFYERYSLFTNCGSFALRVKEWYCPISLVDREFMEPEREDMAWDMHNDGVDFEEIRDIFLEWDVNAILKDFENEIRIVESREAELESDEELIAFRECVEDMGDWISVDFHFRVYRDGLWQEKMGSGDVMVCEGDIEDDEWAYSADLIYSGPIVYFAHKIGF